MELIHEYYGSNFYASRSGWFLSADWMKWQPYCSTRRGLIPGLLPDLSVYLRESFPGYHPTAICSLFEACLELADWLLGPIDFRASFVPAARNLEVGYFIYSSYHDLVGEALRASTNILFDFFHNDIAANSLSCQHQHDFARSLKNRAESAMADAFSNAVVVHAAQLGLHIDFPVPFTLPVMLPPVLQIGIGVNSRILYATGTDRDSYVGTKLCRLKPKCNEILSSLGIPVPRNILLRGKSSFESLIHKTSAIGYPCVVKPANNDRGIGVTIDVCNPSALLQAIARADASGSFGVLIEEQVPGDYYRLYVIGEELVSIMRLRPPFLLGDGFRSVEDILNSPASHSELPGGVVAGSVVSIEDPSVQSQLALQGLSAASVPRSGQMVVLRADLMDRQDWSSTSFNSNIDLSLSNMARRISRAFALENVGIDVICPDITLPYSSRKIWVIDVNPFQLFHPAWASIFLEQLFPSFEEAQIPIKVIVCCGEYLNLSDLSGSLKEQSFDVWAVPECLAVRNVLADDIVNDKRFYCYKHPKEILLDRNLNSAVFLIDWDTLLRNGLPALCIDQLQLIGSLSGTRLKQWESLLKRLGFYETSQSCCDLLLEG